MKTGNDSNQLNYHSDQRLLRQFSFLSVYTHTWNRISGLLFPPGAIVQCCVPPLCWPPKNSKKKVNSEEDNKSDAKSRLPSNKSGSFFRDVNQIPKWILMPQKKYVPKSLRDVSMSLILQKTLFFVWKNLHTTLTRVIQWCTEDVLMDWSTYISTPKNSIQPHDLASSSATVPLAVLPVSFILPERPFFWGM